MPEPEQLLKTRIRRSGYSVREVADLLRRPYGTVACWLNGFAPLPVDVRKLIVNLIDKRDCNAIQIESISSKVNIK
jgi:hypothetical protein